MPERGSKTSTVPVVWANFWNFFGAIKMISCRDWWPWTKPGYITMTWRQSNNQWSGGIAVTQPQKISSAKIRWKILASIFWDQDGILLIDYHSKDQTINAEYYLSLLVQLKDRCRKDVAGSSPRGSGSCTMPRLIGHLQPRRNWPTWASSVLITHPILRIWTRRTTTSTLDWNKQMKVHHFSSDGDVIAAAETCLEGQPSEFILNGVQKLGQRTKKCIELRGDYVEWIPSLVAVACFLPGRAKDLSAPLVLRVSLCISSDGQSSIGTVL